MIITCPNCQTRYQVAEKAIGSAGRKVMCAHCHQSWQAMREQATLADEEDKLFGAADEAAMDDAFLAEERRSDMGNKAGAPVSGLPGENDDGESALPGRPDPNAAEKRKKALARRRRMFSDKLPLARMRRLARMVIFTALVVLVGGGIALRGELVRVFPEMAGVFEAVGLGVNVIGLEFADVETLRSLNEGNEVTVITARIVNISGRPISVPPVVISLLDEKGASLYEWTVRAELEIVGPGETTQFETQLASAPAETDRVQLAFANSR